jgi:hypothetical protein
MHICAVNDSHDYQQTKTGHGEFLNGNPVDEAMPDDR